MNGFFLAALKSLYENVNCAVKVNNSLSTWFQVDCGVKQGCILSPLLFALYIDSLIQELNAKEVGVMYGDGMLSTLLYADDIVLIAPSELNLQSMIKVVEKWCRSWQMSLNVDKTNIVHFRKKGRGSLRSNFVFTFQSRVITYSSYYKYLGLLFNEHLDWDQATEAILAKANRALTALNHKARTCGGFHFKTYTMLFNQLIIPIITTNAFIWGHKEYKSIFRVQYNGMRFLLGVGKACSIVGLFGETGWVPLSLTIKFCILRYYNRLSSMGSNRIASKMYTWSNSLADRGKQN